MRREVSVRFAPGGVRPRNVLPGGVAGTLVLAFLVVVALGALFQLAWNATRSTSGQVAQTLQVSEHVERVLSTLKDAETGQRGYLLTGSESYLEPYTDALANLPPLLGRLEVLLDDPDQAARFWTVRNLAAAKMEELEQTVRLAREGNAAAALALVKTNRGKNIMDELRRHVSDISVAQRRRLENQQEADRTKTERARNYAWGGVVLLLGFLVFVSLRIAHDHRNRTTDAWVRMGQNGFNERVLGESSLHLLGEKTLAFLVPYLDAAVGAIYLAESDERFVRVAAFALSVGTPDVVSGHATLVAETAHQRRPLHVRDVPPGYMVVGSGLGEGTPRELLLVPAVLSGKVLGVLEFGFLRRVGSIERELLGGVAEILAVAANLAIDRERRDREDSAASLPEPGQTVTMPTSL